MPSRYQTPCGALIERVPLYDTAPGGYGSKSEPVGLDHQLDTTLEHCTPERVFEAFHVPHQIMLFLQFDIVATRHVVAGVTQAVQLLPSQSSLALSAAAGLHPSHWIVYRWQPDMLSSSRWTSSSCSSCSPRERMRKDAKGWERMGKDGKGWERMGKDGKGWERWKGETRS